MSGKRDFSRTRFSKEDPGQSMNEQRSLALKRNENEGRGEKMINLVRSALPFFQSLPPFHVLSADAADSTGRKTNTFAAGLKRAAQNGFEIKLRRAIIKCWNALLITRLSRVCCSLLAYPARERERESQRNGAASKPAIAPVFCPEESYPLTEC